MNNKHKLYLCNRKRCDHCSFPKCYMTTDIKYAKTTEDNDFINLYYKINNIEEKAQRAYNKLLEVYEKEDPTIGELTAAIGESIGWLGEILDH